MQAQNNLQIVFGRGCGWSLFVLLCMLVGAVLVGSFDWSCMPSECSGVEALLVAATKLGAVLFVGGLLACVGGITTEFFVNLSLTVQPTSLCSILTQGYVTYPFLARDGLRRPPRLSL